MSFRTGNHDGFQPIPLSNQSHDHIVNIPLEPIESQYNKEGQRSANSREYTRPAADRQDTSATLGPANMFGRGGRRRKLNRGRGDVGKTVDGEQDAITRAGKFYEMVLNFSFITRYLIYVVPLATLLAIPVIIGLTAAKTASLGGVRIVWIFAWAEVVWGSLWGSKIVAKCLPYVFKQVVGVISSGTRKYYKVIQALEIPLSLVGWTFTSWVTLIPMMTRNPDQRREHDTVTQPWESTLDKALAAALISSLIWFLKCVLIQIISVKYHQVQFALRIKTNKEKIKMLSELFGISRELFPSYCPEFAEEDYILHSTIAGSGMVTPGHHRRSGSATPMRVLGQIGRIGDNLTSALGNVAKEVTGKNVLNPNSPYSIVLDALLRRASSEALARRIWMSFVEEGKDSLYAEDFVEVMGYEHREIAKDAFAILDSDGNGDVGLEEMISAVVDISRERKSLGKSMGDIDNAIQALDSLLAVIVGIVVVFVFVAFLNANFTTTLATAGTTLLSLSFVFSVTAQEILGSCIFIFVKHPYDVGDRVAFDGVDYVVEHIALLNTVFKVVSTGKSCQLPNNILNNKLVENVTRSKAMQELVFIDVNFDTSMEDIMLLRDELYDFVDQNSRDFRSENLNIEISSITLGQLELKIEIKHKGNWADEAKRLERRNKFMTALVLALRKVPIYAPGAGDPGLGEAGKPQFTVSISASEAEERMRQAAAAKAAAHVKVQQQVHDAAATTLPTAPIITQTSASPQPNRGSTPQSQVGLAIASGNNFVDSRDEVLERSNSRMSNDSARRRDVNEVRDLLRRQSTTGRRRRDGAGSPYQLSYQATDSNNGDYQSGQSSQLAQSSASPAMGGIQEQDSPPQSSGGGPPPQYSHERHPNFQSSAPSSPIVNRISAPVAPPPPGPPPRGPFGRV